MILSFHPCFEADNNIICAGRLPNESDLNLIKNAKAVILSQGCSKELYHLAYENCRNVFPNFDAKFSHPGKIGQIELFKSMQVSYPESCGYSSISDFFSNSPFKLFSVYRSLPFVFKFNWGGEGETVFLVETLNVFRKLLSKAKIFEKSGCFGFLLQKYISSSARTLRVVVIGSKIIAYWKIHNEDLVFGEHLSKGAYIDKNVSSKYLIVSTNIIKDFCNKTKINLAGFDLIFDKNDNRPIPLLLEINYFFGRTGLGGSEQYYKLLCTEICKWIASL